MLILRNILAQSTCNCASQEMKRDFEGSPAEERVQRAQQSLYATSSSSSAAQPASSSTAAQPASSSSAAQPASLDADILREVEAVGRHPRRTKEAQTEAERTENALAKRVHKN